jgi:uncharacterized protein YceK
MARVLALVLGVLLLGGCASTAYLYNPQTGEYVECVPHWEAAGMHANREACVRQYVSQEFRRVEKPGDTTSPYVAPTSR